MAKKEELIEQLADKYHISEDEAEKAVNSQFKFVAEKMASGNFPEIRLPYFGLFGAKESRIKHLNKSKQEKNNNNGKS